MPRLVSELTTPYSGQSTMAGPLQAQKVAKQRISGYIRSKIFCRAYISVLYSDRIIAVCRMVLLCVYCIYMSTELQLQYYY